MAPATLYRIPAGCSVPIHSGPGYAAMCRLLPAAGSWFSPGGREVDYHGPEIFMFEPGALHGWHDVIEDTLLTVCEVKP